MSFSSNSNRPLTDGPNNDVLVMNCPNDTISCLTFSPSNNFLVAGSWNKDACCWDIQSNGVAVPKAKISHNAPILCAAFASDGQRVFTGSCDMTAKQWSLATNQTTQVAAHDAPIKEIFWINEGNLLVTGSWDKTVRYWDTRQPRAVCSVPMPERVYCMDVLFPLMVVGTAERHLLIYDLRKPTNCFRQFASPLKFQSRCVANFPDRSGFAVGSIEGRVGISHVEQKDLKKNFAFKCHRQNNDVYAVNSISFHQRYGTFATCGSDGTYVFWDKDSKQRLKLFNRNAQPITCSAFNRDGTIFGYATGYDWSKGAENWDKTKLPQIYLHPVQDVEIQPRKKE